MSTLEIENLSEDAQRLQGHANVDNLLFGYAESLVLRCAVELRIADIIHSHGQPMSLSQIASKIDSPNPDVACLSRVMRLLVRKKVFTLEHNNTTNEVMYGLTPGSMRLLHDHELGFAPLFLTFSHPWLIAPWHELGRSIKDGGAPFERAHGQTMWEMASKDTAFNNLFNSGMASVTKSNLIGILKGYKDGFTQMKGTLVDVGGGFGQAVSEIVKAHPHIQGINFDLPHVVATAPQYPGVTHVGGDMFKEIPDADTVLMKSILHDWGNEDCLKILKNCQKAVFERKGKVIIVDIVLHPEGNGLFDDFKLYCDLLMMALFVGGKERTEDEWGKLLNKAGFARYNIVTLPTLTSVIEAYPC